ncbi:MAG: response regulator transcription factor [Eubacterium sp.]|nr:response regulator transcription factor [Eubacterium sp.]
MRIKIAIVDDYPDDTNHLRSLIEKTAPEAVTDCFGNGLDFFACFFPEKYDIIFLDIQMDDMDGIELAGRIRSTDPATLIVFQSTSREYAFDAFPVHPFDYITKPFGEDEIRKVFDEAYKVLIKEPLQITVRVAYGEISVPVDKIISVISDRHNVIFNIQDSDEIRGIETFTFITEELSAYPAFTVCNRGVIINMDHVINIYDDSVKMSDGSICSFRVRDKKELRLYIAQYKIRGMKETVL